MWIRLKTLGWLLALPVPIVGLLPWWLARTHGGAAWEAHPLQWLGAWLILNGLGLAGWCVNLFNVHGQGTPVPFDPPKRFVATGPYRFVRNPMVLGMGGILWGQALAYRSAWVVAYAAILSVLAVGFVLMVEEPQLERRFGEAYREYRQAVPGWWPRCRPWTVR